jgi:hypothetical protein
MSDVWTHTSYIANMPLHENQHTRHSLSPLPVHGSSDLQHAYSDSPLCKDPLTVPEMRHVFWIFSLAKQDGGQPRSF